MRFKDLTTIQQDFYHPSSHTVRLETMCNLYNIQGPANLNMRDELGQKMIVCGLMHIAVCSNLIDRVRCECAHKSQFLLWCMFTMRLSLHTVTYVVLPDTFRVMAQRCCAITV